MENVSDVVAAVITAVLPLLTAGCGWLAGRIQKLKKQGEAREAEQKRKDAAREEEMKAVKNGLKGLLRAKVIDLGLHYIDEKAVPPYGMETLRSCYDPYMALGDGDPSVTHIMKKCESLPVRSGSE